MRLGTSTVAPVSRTADFRSNTDVNAANVDALGAATGTGPAASVHAPAAEPATRHCTCAVTAVAPPRGGPPAATTTLPEEVAPVPGDVNDAASLHPNPYVTVGDVFSARDTAVAVIPCAPLTPTLTVTVVFAPKTAEQDSTEFAAMADKLKIRPLHDRVIIQRLDAETRSPGGIVIPDSAAEKPIRGKVVAVGKGKILENGNVRALDIKVGDHILFGKYSGTEVKVDGEEYLVMREEDVMAVIEK